MFRHQLKMNVQHRVAAVLALELEYQHQPQHNESPNEL